MTSDNEHNSRFSSAEIQMLLKEAERFNKGDGLAVFLIRNGFEKTADELYIKKNPEQQIKLQSEAGQITYKNLLNLKDSGTHIQFIQNRLPDGNTITPNNDLSKFLTAVQIALYYEKMVLKHRARKPIQQKTPQKRKGPSR